MSQQKHKHSLPVMEIFSNSFCPRSCPRCDKSYAMRRYPDYQFTPAMAEHFVDKLLQHDCKINIVLFVGGEPLFWDHFKKCVSLLRQSGMVDQIMMITALVEGMEMNEYEQYFDQINVSDYGNNRYLIEKHAVGNPKYDYYSKENQNYIPRGRIEGTIPCHCPHHHSWLFDGRVYYCQIAGPLFLSDFDLKMSREEMDSYSWSIDDFLMNVDQCHAKFGERNICEACHNNPLVMEILGRPDEPQSVHGGAVYQIR